MVLHVHSNDYSVNNHEHDTSDSGGLGGISNYLVIDLAMLS